VARFGAGGSPFTREIGLSVLGVEHGHLGGGVAKQLHECGQADARAKHLGGVGVAEHVGRDHAIDAQERTHLGQCAAKFPEQRIAVVAACQQPSIWRHRAERAKEAQPVDELADRIIHGNQPFGVQLAQGHVKCPLPRSELAQAVEGKIGALAQANAGVTDEQESIAGDIVTVQEFLLNELVLLGSQWARQLLIAFGNIVGREQAE
jgi:hypothetical protein